MGKGYFDFLYANQEKRGEESAVQDEAIIKPWTHRFTVYCSNPSKEFMGLLKNDESVVAVYEKEKNAVKA